MKEFHRGRELGCRKGREGKSMPSLRWLCLSSFMIPPGLGCPQPSAPSRVSYTVSPRGSCGTCSGMFSKMMWWAIILLTNQKKTTYKPGSSGKKEYEHYIFLRCLFLFLNEANNPVGIRELGSAGEWPQNTTEVLVSDVFQSTLYLKSH